MNELYLIAHKVRGEPAFDVAQRMVCPECHGQCGGEYIACAECDNEGFWWIIPTSGHRAYPYWYTELNNLYIGETITVWKDGAWSGQDPTCDVVPEMPPGLPDHYTTHAAPSRPSLAALLPKAPVYRRF